MSGGFAIAIAWPETVCRGAGSWYDVPMSILGIRKAGYYKVGHAAVVLVNSQSQLCHYFDFGRYLTPIGMGGFEARNQITIFKSDQKQLFLLVALRSQIFQKYSQN